MKTISACYRLNASFKQLQPLPRLDDDALAKLASGAARAARRWTAAAEATKARALPLVQFMPLVAASSRTAIAA